MPVISPQSRIRSVSNCGMSASHLIFPRFGHASIQRKPSEGCREKPPKSFNSLWLSKASHLRAKRRLNSRVSTNLPTDKRREISLSNFSKLYELDNGQSKRSSDRICAA